MVVFMRKILLACTLFGLCSLYAPQARADVFVWQDPETGLFVSFPDTWKVLNNQQPDTVFTIRAPGELDEAVCRIRVRQDRRYLIYPPRYARSAQRQAYSQDFWDAYLTGEYNRYTVKEMNELAGLGRGFASMALASFTQQEANIEVDKGGLMFAALYHDKAYIVECSAYIAAYDKWNDEFQAVIDSIDFKKEIFEIPTGNYRDFLNE